MEKYSYKYFENHDCKYYPCHKKTKHINCLFCFCPLFGWKGKCINYNYEDCINCSFPHKKKNYFKVMELLHGGKIKRKL